MKSFNEPLTAKECSSLRKLIYYDNLKLKQEAVLAQGFDEDALSDITKRIEHNLELAHKLHKIEGLTVR